MLRSAKEVRRAGPGQRKAARSVPEKSAAAHGEGSEPEVSLEESPPVLEEMESFEKVEESAAAEPARPEAGAYQRLVAVADQIFTAAAEGTALDEGAVIAALRQVLAQLQQSDGLLAETVRQRRETRTWPQRAANTAVLSMRLGLEIEYDDRRCLAVGLCALMHDLGMLKVSEEVLNSRRLTLEQQTLLHQHPVESQKMVTAFRPAFAWIGKIVVQVHERQDGSGYPRGLRGDEIHEMARIIGLADTYEAMTHPRADREGRVTYHALKEIIDLRTSLFERRLIKALINIVSIFPLGSLVQLNNGEIGRVIGTSRLHPTRPAVEILVDSRGRRLEEPHLLNLEDEPMLYIVDPAIEESVLEE